MLETFKLLGRLFSKATHSILPSNFLLNKRSLLRVENSHVIDERSVKIVFFKSSRSDFRRVKNASSNDLKIRRNTQKSEESEREKRCRELFDDNELTVQFVDDDEHLTLEVRRERQRRLLARRIHDDNESEAKRYERKSRNKTSRRLYEIGGSDINEGM